MTTIVHLCGPDLDEAQIPALRCLVHRLDRFEHVVAALDPARAARLQARLDWPVLSSARRFDRTDPLTWVAWLGDPVARRLDSGETKVLLHTFELDALVAAVRLTCGLRVAALSRAPRSARATRLLRVVSAQTTRIVTGSQSARRKLVEAGVPLTQVTVIRNPVDFRAINDARSRSLRRRLIADAEGPIVLIPGPATRDGGQRSAVWAAAIVQQIYPGLRIMVPFDSPARDGVRRFLDGGRMGHLWIDPPREWGWPELVTAADLMVDAAPHDTLTEPLAWAMAAGLPIVGVATRAVAELIAHTSNGLLCRSADPALLASTIVSMWDDPARRRVLADTARGQAYEVFSIREFTDNMGRLYDNLISGRPADEGVRDTAMVG